MGRKIPGAKHRGVKDPEKQRAQRLADLKTKINNPPTDDDQAIPKSLQQVIKLKEDLKSGRIGIKKKKKTKKEMSNLIKVGGGGLLGKIHPKARPEKAVPVFNQKPNETTYKFLHRVDRETQNFLNETAFEKKYDVQVKRNPQTGIVEGLEKKPKDELDELMKLKMKHQNIKKKKKKVSLEPKLSKSQKRRKKLEEKKARKIDEDIDEFKEFKEEIKFGEVAHAPPEITVRPKKVDNNIKPRPAKKDLLLKSLLSNGNPAKTTPKTIDKSGKRKNLPSAERRILEKQQNEIVAAYRLLKAKKMNQDA